MTKTAAADAWDHAAEGWNRSMPLVHAWLRPATAAMLAAARLDPGGRVLDLAAGTGGQTKAIAQAVGPTGSVLATDISPQILDFARHNLGAEGLTQVRFRVADAEQRIHAEPPFDAVTCRLGLMFCQHPAAAVAASFAALRPGGRFVALVFGEPARNPCVAIMLEVARRHRGLGAAVSPHPAGSLFSLGEAGTLEGLLAGAGFVDVEVASLAAPFELPDAASYIAFVQSGGSPIMELLAPLAAPARQAAWQEMEAALGQFQSAAGWRGPNALLLCSATRPK